MYLQMAFHLQCSVSFELFHTARMLRGLRIAARLGLEISGETKDAIYSLSSTIKCLRQVSEPNKLYKDPMLSEEMGCQTFSFSGDLSLNYLHSFILNVPQTGVYSFCGPASKFSLLLINMVFEKNNYNILQDRIMLEINYMLSYGAAEPSLRLLWRFKLLEILLPLQVISFSACILSRLN